MARTRLIRPEFFADETLSVASDTVRLFYVGLWTLCDDAGYFEARPRQIAASLYPYRRPASREATTLAALSTLVELERVTLLDCGQHGVVPTLPRHGQKGGNKSETYYSRHKTGCVRTGNGRVRTPSTDKSSSESVLVSDSESVSEGAQAREKTTGLKARLGEYGDVVSGRVQ
jgi:hypothetical protein